MMTSTQIKKAGRTKEAMSFLAEKLSENVTLNDLAKELKVSRVTLINHFKEVFNSTPIDFHWDIKCLVAAYLIHEYKDVKIQNIIGLLGFKSTEHFCRRIKRLFGFSAKKLRKPDAFDIIQDKATEIFVTPLLASLKVFPPLTDKDLNEGEKEAALYEEAFFKLAEMVDTKAVALEAKIAEIAAEIYKKAA